MIYNEIITNTIKLHKNMFNSTFNMVNAVIEHVETALIVNTPKQYKKQADSFHVMSETMKDKFNTMVNDGYDRIEAFCAVK